MSDRTPFELRDADAAGRLGELSIPRADATIETPALLPVVNPHLQTVTPTRLAEEFGARILITNAYVLYGSDDLREAAREQGVHELLGFDGPIMTDSGAFQLAEYGDIDVTTEEILAFQHAIGSDIGTPVDVPTPPDAGRERAEADLETTRARLERAAELAGGYGDMLVTAPIQGSTYPDLRERAARHADATGLDLFPVGAMVPLMRAYRFAEVIEAVAAAKRGLGADAPVHLFGAGHPMLFALAAAVGCDLFDSAAYALYARDGRYLTVRGTERLDALEEFPCACPVCTEWTPGALREADESAREERVASHNLHVSFGEMRRVRQAIREGNLLELVETRARAHPAMLDGYRALLDHRAALERSDPTEKDAFFYLSTESARRPEVARHHDRLRRLDPPESVLVAAVEQPAAGDYDAVWECRPPFGPVPPALAGTYPLTAQVPERSDPAARRAAVRGIAALVEAHSDTAVAFVHDGWSSDVLAELPGTVRVIDAE